jgi:hypothetical protein
MSHGGALRSAVQRSHQRTPLTGGKLPLVADHIVWNPTLLTCIWTWSLPSSMLCPPVSFFPQLCRLLRFAPPWPLRTLVAPLGCPPPPRPPADSVADSLAPLPGHTAGPFSAAAIRGSLQTPRASVPRYTVWPSVAVSRLRRPLRMPPRLLAAPPGPSGSSSIPPKLAPTNDVQFHLLPRP